MQLGTRWQARTEPPARVPAEMRAQIAACDAGIADELLPAFWTLTWLESRPVAELDTGMIVSLAADGSVTTFEA